MTRTLTPARRVRVRCHVRAHRLTSCNLPFRLRISKHCPWGRDDWGDQIDHPIQPLMRMVGWRKPKLHARADSSISPRPRPSLACACVTSVSPRAAQMDPHQIFHGIVALYGPVCRVSPPPTHHIASLAASVPALRVAQHRPVARSRWTPVYSTVRIEQGRN